MIRSRALICPSYIKCELHIEKPEERSGAPIEGGGRAKEGEHKRKTKHSKGEDPDFGGERLEFTTVSVVEEFSFVRCVISDLRMESTPFVGCTQGSTCRAVH